MKNTGGMGPALGGIVNTAKKGQTPVLVPSSPSVDHEVIDAPC